MAKSITKGKYQVKIQCLRLQCSNFDSDNKDLLLLKIDIAWKSQSQIPSLLMAPFPYPKTRRECTKKPRSMSMADVDSSAVFEWDDEFENTCNFTVNSRNDSFDPWNVCFRVLQQGRIAESEKETVMGKASLNIAELATKMESSSIERKIPISLQVVAGNAIEASLSVTLSFVEVRISDQLGADSAGSDGWLRIARAFGIQRGRKKQRKPQSMELDSSSSDLGFEPGKTSKGFWKKRRLSFSSAKVKSEPLIETCSGTCSLPCTPRSWEMKELVSRDGKFKLQSNVFFASFDQRSKEADGEGACAALVAVFAHWLHSNGCEIPTRIEFDSLIREGSMEWRRLLEAHNDRFFNGHFDLETILEAEIRPLTVRVEKSFTGFFIPDRFDSLEGAMSFDEIWHRLSESEESEFVYIVCWNDHFFVVMSKGGCYYIVDSLGERLFEGCSQGFILRLDESSSMEENNGEVICRGKDCCREFIKRFLAKIPLEEVEEEQRKLGSDDALSILSLHRKLQIEFHYTSITLNSSNVLE